MARAKGIKNGSQTEKVYAFIVAETATTGFPSRTQIAAHMGWKTTSGVTDAFSRLVIWGKLKRMRTGNNFTYEVV